MPDVALKPVDGSIAKARGGVEVGEDLGFQRKWWRFERILWSVFALIVGLDLVGAFGRGFLADAHRTSRDGTFEVDYERIERSGAPSVLTLRFGPGAISDGKVRVFMSDSLVRELGGQRVIPEPEVTATGAGGMTYTFAASGLPAQAAFALAPRRPGLFHLRIGTSGLPDMNLGIAVVP